VKPGDLIIMRTEAWWDPEGRPKWTQKPALLLDRKWRDQICVLLSTGVKRWDTDELWELYEPG
jgi:hypothetical protein